MELATICRMCSLKKTRLKSIFHDYGPTLLDTIVSVVRLRVSVNDGLPAGVCKRCTVVLLQMKANVDQFRAADEMLRRKFCLHENVKQDEIPLSPVEGVDKIATNTDYASVEHPDELTNDHLAISMPKPIVIKHESLHENANELSDSTEEQDCSGYVDNESDSDGTKHTSNGSKAAKRNQSSRKAPSTAKSGTVSRRQHRRDPNRPKLNDHKCYICKSESMGSAKALLEHLSAHLDLMPYTCKECVMETVVLKHVRSLNLHKKMHAQPIKCEYCDRRYSDTWAKDGHVKTYHLGEGAPCPSSCEQCGKVCRSISALKSHMRDHKLDVRCHLCDKLFHRHSKLREHVTRVHEKAEKYECNICNHVVHSLESYNSHLKMHNAEKTYSCDLCPMKFYTAGNLGLHKKVHAKNANYKPHKDWTSHYTVAQSEERGKVYTCNHCGNTYSGSINTIISHVKHHFKDLQCDQCELKFTNKHKLKIHYVVHTRERNYSCEYCGKDFLYRTHMTHHIKHKHRTVGQAAEGGRDMGSMSFLDIPVDSSR